MVKRWKLNDTVRQTLPDGTTKDWTLIRVKGPNVNGFVYGGDEYEFQSNAYTLSRPEEDDLTMFGNAFSASEDRPADFAILSDEDAQAM